MSLAFACSQSIGAPISATGKNIEEIFGIPMPSMVQMASVYSLAFERMSSPLHEMMNLAAVTALLQPKNIFEFGTFLGVSALMMAKNAPQVKIFTLDLPQEKLADNNIMNPKNVPNPYKVGEFLPDDADSKNITQLLGNSREYDFSPYFGKMDLIFVDASHTYEDVRSDSENAFKMLRKGGCIVRDDYHWEDAYWCAGVTQYLNEEMENYQTYRIKNTRLGVYFDRYDS